MAKKITRRAWASPDSSKIEAIRRLGRDAFELVEWSYRRISTLKSLGWNERGEQLQRLANTEALFTKAMRKMLEACGEVEGASRPFALDDLVSSLGQLRSSLECSAKAVQLAASMARADAAPRVIGRVNVKEEHDSMLDGKRTKYLATKVVDRVENPLLLLRAAPQPARPARGELVHLVFNSEWVLSRETPRDPDERDRYKRMLAALKTKISRDADAWAYAAIAIGMEEPCATAKQFWERRRKDWEDRLSSEARGDAA